MQEKHKVTPRARAHARKLLEAAESDPLMTINEVADLLGVARRNAQIWLKKLESTGLIRRELVPAGEYGGRQIYISRILPPTGSSAGVEHRSGGDAGSPPILTPSKTRDSERMKEERRSVGGDADDFRVDVESLAASDFSSIFDSAADRSVSIIRRRTLPAEILSELPKFPDTRTVCEPARSPKQPRLTGVSRYDVQVCIEAFKCVHLQRYGKRPRVDGSAKYRMRKVVMAMHRLGILEPYAWAMFRCQAWEHGRSQDDKKADGKNAASRPKIDSIFAVPILTTSAEVYKDQRHKFMVPRSRLAPSHVRLGQLWYEARDALLQSNPASRLEARSVVNSILSPALYAELRDKAIKEVAAMNEFARAQLRAGRWVWGYTA